MIYLLVSILLFSCSSNKNSTTTINLNSVIGKPVRMGNLEIAEKDFPKLMNWEDAKKACKDLGDVWRLPTKDELDEIYKNKKSIGGFTENLYWSSSESTNDLAWLQFFSNGYQEDDSKFNALLVRAVRTF